MTTTELPQEYRHHLTLWHADHGTDLTKWHVGSGTGEPPGGNVDGPYGYPVFAQIRYGSVFTRCQSCGRYWRNLRDDNRRIYPRQTAREQVFAGHTRMRCFRNVRHLTRDPGFRKFTSDPRRHSVGHMGIRKFEAWWMLVGALSWKLYQLALPEVERSVPDYIRYGLYDPRRDCWLQEVGSDPRRCLSAMGITDPDLWIATRDGILLNPSQKM